MQDPRNIEPLKSTILTVCHFTGTQPIEHIQWTIESWQLSEVKLIYLGLSKAQIDGNPIKTNVKRTGVSGQCLRVKLAFCSCCYEGTCPGCWPTWLQVSIAPRYLPACQYGRSLDSKRWRNGLGQRGKYTQQDTRGHEENTATVLSSGASKSQQRSFFKRDSLDLPNDIYSLPNSHPSHMLLHLWLY